MLIETRGPGIVLLALAIGACGDAHDAARDTSAAGTSAAPSAVASPATRSHVALDGDGIRVVNAGTGSTRPIAFGASAEQAIAAAVATSGALRSRGTNEDCGAGPMEILTFPDGLHLHVQSGRFVGWSVSAVGAETPRTMSGIGLGSTRAELEAAYAADVRRTTLGMEFAAGGLQGVLASGAADARVTALWAGASCVAR